MIIQKSLATASLFAILSFNNIPLYAETPLKSSKFLNWTEANRSFYIRTSIGMAAFIAVQNDKKHAKCMEHWYFSNEKRSNQAIYKVMRKFSDYHPWGVIVAVLEKQCGSFKYKNR